MPEEDETPPLETTAETTAVEGAVIAEGSRVDAEHSAEEAEEAAGRAEGAADAAEDATETVAQMLAGFRSEMQENFTALHGRIDKIEGAGQREETHVENEGERAEEEIPEAPTPEIPEVAVHRRRWRRLGE